MGGIGFLALSGKRHGSIIRLLRLLQWLASSPGPGARAAGHGAAVGSPLGAPLPGTLPLPAAGAAGPGVRRFQRLRRKGEA